VTFTGRSSARSTTEINQFEPSVSRPAPIRSDVRRAVEDQQRLPHCIDNALAIGKDVSQACLLSSVSARQCRGIGEQSFQVSEAGEQILMSLSTTGLLID
jgi:hypothetical protein